ncbi:FMN-binding negative transcriptional regulator [Methylococcus sp. EFPC2]|uniref:FMN-binding negative transcriptional regulator n=1 Tax=Methylococcus sp. EFPC2 TaxID=2812648 RepID=UPI001966E651|nr:FMN-binding negative transcriptional regulator [Methylococcus sp. EFPC2]QSA96448.1 FMN-binding negative transcriptional regulator [Methylococcus sp. EFPC2]
MYIPKQFDEPRIDVLHELIRARPLATLITLSSGGLNANHIPLHLTAEPTPFGTLRGHVARSNPIWSDFSKDVEVLAVFHGPDVYIRPSWYSTKAETGKVVPTWNYTVAHAYGALRVIDDASWLRAHLETFTASNEAAFPDPWHLSDAPHDFTDKLIEAVVGIEIVVSRLSGKWKVSQNQPPQNQAGVAHGLRSSALAESLEMAALVEDYEIASPAIAPADPRDYPAEPDTLRHCAPSQT